MKASLKLLWIDALLSGAYRQGTGYLRQNAISDGEPEHCCLGVLCDVSGVGEWDDQVFKYAGDESESILPRSLAKDLGLTMEQQDILWKMNDRDRAPFEDIAQWIDEHIEATA